MFRQQIKHEKGAENTGVNRMSSGAAVFVIGPAGTGKVLRPCVWGFVGKYF